MDEKKFSKNEKSLSSITTLYLIYYNSIQFIGWTFTFLLILQHLATKQTYVGVWDHANVFLTCFQSLQALEILHVAVGIVESSLVITGLQVSQRVYYTWLIMHQIPEISNNFTVTTMVFAWSAAESTRYLFYVTLLLKKDNNLVNWCRYNFFLVLYPAGIASEVTNVYYALPYIKAKELASISMGFQQRFFPTVPFLPTSLSFTLEYYHIVIFINLLNFPVLPMLYRHMISQRRKYFESIKKKEVLTKNK